MPTCEKCNGPGERTDGGEWLCPRCGVWLNVVGNEIGPPITPEQAGANYEKFVVDTATEMLRTAENVRVSKRRGHSTMEEIKRACRIAVEHGRPLSYDGFQMEHEDGWIYEYTAGEKPRRVRKATE